jgi:hypothetical protein
VEHEKHLIPGSDLVPFLNEGNLLGLGTCAAMLVHHFSVWLCGSAGITMLSVNSKKYFHHFAKNKIKFYIFKSNTISYDIRTIVHFVKCI